MANLDQFEQDFANLMAEYDFSMGLGELPVDEPKLWHEVMDKRLLALEDDIHKSHERITSQIAAMGQLVDKPHQRLAVLEKQMGTVLEALKICMLFMKAEVALDELSNSSP